MWGSAGRSTSPAPVALLRRLNGVLPADVRVHRVGTAADGFDARFSALWRRYAYRIADAPELVDPLGRRCVVAWPRRLDLDAMNAAAALLTGEHDFAAFCSKREGATTIRTLSRPVVGPGSLGHRGRDGPGRRVLPQHGAGADGLPGRGREGGVRRPGPARCCGPAPATPASP